MDKKITIELSANDLRYIQEALQCYNSRLFTFMAHYDNIGNITALESLEKKFKECKLFLNYFLGICRKSEETQNHIKK